MTATFVLKRGQNTDENPQIGAEIICWIVVFTRASLTPRFKTKSLKNSLICLNRCAGMLPERSNMITMSRFASHSENTQWRHHVSRVDQQVRVCGELTSFAVETGEGAETLAAVRVQHVNACSEVLAWIRRALVHSCNNSNTQSISAPVEHFKTFKRR